MIGRSKNDVSVVVCSWFLENTPSSWFCTVYSIVDSTDLSTSAVDNLVVQQSLYQTCQVFDNGCDWLDRFQFECKSVWAGGGARLIQQIKKAVACEWFPGKDAVFLSTKWPQKDVFTFKWIQRESSYLLMEKKKLQNKCLLFKDLQYLQV